MAHLPDMVPVDAPMGTYSAYGAPVPTEEGYPLLNPAQFDNGIEGQGHLSNLNPMNGMPATGPDPYAGLPVNEY